MRQLSIQEISDTIKVIDIDKNDRYLLTYSAYLSYFSSLKTIYPEDILRGLGFVYSWMPRVLTIMSNELDSFTAAVNTFKLENNQYEKTRTLESAIKLTRGSIVGSSKLLHFIFPNEFPIYDTHIYKYCWQDEKSYHYNMKNESNYRKYMNTLVSLTGDVLIPDLRDIVASKLGYQVGDLRSIEFSIFNISKFGPPNVVSEVPR